MVMSITSALQQKHQEEQNSLCNAVKLLMQSPGYIVEFVRNFLFVSPSLPLSLFLSCCTLPPPPRPLPSRQVGDSVNVKVLLIAPFAAHSVFHSPHGRHISQGEV